MRSRQLSRNLTKIFLLLTFWLSFAGSQLYADDSGLYGFAGVGFGYANSGEDVVVDRSGIHIEAKGLLAYYKPSIIFDLGLGWFYNEIDNSNSTVRTKSAFIEASPRYRFNKFWNLGPVLMAALANDNSFSAISNKESSEIFLGLRLEYDPNLFKFNKVRLNATIQRDLTIDLRDVTLFTVGIQFGIPFGDQNVKYSVKEKIIYKTRYIPKIIKIGKNRLKATFDGTRGLGCRN